MAKSALYKAAVYEQIFQDLGNRNETKFFDNMKDVFMFALALGFKHNKKEVIVKSGGEPISLRIFTDEDENIFNVIALSHTNDISILLDDDDILEKKYKLMEEFANGGMSIIADAFCKPVVDESEFKKFIELYNEENGQSPRSSLEDLLAGAIDSI